MDSQSLNSFDLLIELLKDKLIFCNMRKHDTFIYYLCFEVRYISVQFSSVAQSCLTLCDPMNRSTPGLPVNQQLPEFTQTHVH